MQTIQKVLKTIQINFNVTLFAPIWQQFWIEILKLTSSCFFITNVNVIFVPCINKSQFVKKLANTCSVPVDDVPIGVSRIFLTHFLDFMNEMEWLRKLKQKI